MELLLQFRVILDGRGDHVERFHVKSGFFDCANHFLVGLLLQFVGRLGIVGILHAHRVVLLDFGDRRACFGERLQLGIAYIDVDRLLLLRALLSHAGGREGECCSE